MTPREASSLPGPTDGTVVHWWVYSEALGDLLAYRATYYVSTEWRDHPWGREDHRGGGVAFVDCWAVEEKYRGRDHWSPLGRRPGWYSVIRSDTGENRAVDPAAAELLLRTKLTSQLDYHLAEADRLRARLSAVEANPFPNLLP